MQLAVVSSRKSVQLTLLVTALANFRRGTESCGLHNTEQYSRNISMPRVTLEMYLLSDFADEGRDEGDKYRKLFFFCRLVGAFGL